LTTDPEKRLTLREIQRHPWFNQIEYNTAPGEIVGIDPLPVDPILAERLTKFGFDLDTAIKEIESNRHNHLTTTYYLLKKKHIRQGGMLLHQINLSSSDLSPKPRRGGDSDRNHSAVRV